MAGDGASFTNKEIVALIARLAVISFATYMGFKVMLEALDPTRNQKIAAKKKVSYIHILHLR